ncbi:MAG: SRPBCC domain-containing protein [Chloroflexota bacterium]
MSAADLVIRSTRQLDAPPDRVHRAWSDPEELSAWYCRDVHGSLLAGVASTLIWSEREEEITVLESDPPGRFRFRRVAAPGIAPTVVTVTIDRVGYGSRVRLEEGPFDASHAGVAEAVAAAAEAWGAALANLRARVDFGVDLRRPVR